MPEAERAYGDPASTLERTADACVVNPKSLLSIVYCGFGHGGAGQGSECALFEVVPHRGSGVHHNCGISART